MLYNKINPLVVELREMSGVPVMLRPSNQKGEVVIKTKFGDVAADMGGNDISICFRHGYYFLDR